MKSIKGLSLMTVLFLTAFSAIKANSITNRITDDIFTAIRSIDYVSINVLLSDGIDIDTVDGDGNTPLMVAAEVGNPRIVDIILSHNPDVNKQNKKGETALMIAAETGQLEICKKLVSHRARVAIRNDDGNTAGSLASKFGHTKIVSFLRQVRSHTTFST